MTNRTYSHRRSATTVLRGLGISVENYNRFITEHGGKFEVDIPKAQKFTASKTVIKAAPADDKKITVSSVIKANIYKGLSNAEIWGIVEQMFGLDKKTRGHYPAWYRAQMRRQGLIK